MAEFDGFVVTRDPARDPVDASVHIVYWIPAWDESRMTTKFDGATFLTEDRNDGSDRNPFDAWRGGISGCYGGLKCRFRPCRT